MRLLAVLCVTLGVVAGSARLAEASYSTWTTGASYWSAPTLAATASGCDDCAQTINLPWAFPYWGRSFTQVTVSSNGTATFGTNASAPFSNYALGVNGGALPGPTIAALWDDWNPGAMGDVYTGSVNGAFVIEWRNLYRFGQASGGTTSFELKLWSDGHFELQYGALGDSGTSATVGMQEDIDTIAQEISVNAQVGSYTGRVFYRPGVAALYINIKDGFYSPSRPRPGLRFTQLMMCGSFNFTTMEATSTTSDWSYGVGTCAGSILGGAAFAGDTSGFDVATIPLSPVTDVIHGTYHFVRRADFTPQPTSYRRDPVYYANTGVSGTSKLDYWQSGGSYDKTTLIVTGFDPLNTSSTAQYLVLLGDLAKTMFAEGRDVAIGKFADGNQRLSSFPGEVGTWVSDAYSRQGSKIQVAGVSMGGVLVRAAVSSNVASVQSKIAAWYSVDSPQTGANLGRGYRGIQNLILCNKDATDPQYRQIFSNAAADMMTLRVSSCSCDDEPENSTCSYTTQYHDGYYNSVGWPTAVPRYAVAFGDANTTNGYAKQGSGTLFDFTYTGWFCSEDRDWNGGQRDCNAGSRYLTPTDVNTDEDASVCGTFKLRLNYQPAFINTDSALGVSTGLWSDTEDGGCGSNYPTLAPTYWNGWASNDYNELHTVLSSGLKNQFMAWNRLYDQAVPIGNPPPPVY